jgi:putative Holliday junction resolvase
LNTPPENSPRSLLALDFGLRRIGVASGTRLTGTASALTTVNADNGIPNWPELDQIVKEWMPDMFVLGLPYNKQGGESEMTAAVRQFAATLESRYQLPTDFVDERYTSAEASTLLKEQRRQGLRNKRVQKSDVDSLSAQLIAESWMRSNE